MNLSALKVYANVSTFIQFIHIKWRKFSVFILKIFIHFQYYTHFVESAYFYEEKEEVNQQLLGTCFSNCFLKIIIKEFLILV